MEKIVLNRILREDNIVKYLFSVSDGLKRYFTTNTFFIEYEQNISNVPISILTIPFVNCMAGLSWLSGSMLFVDEIDFTYYNSFKQIKLAYSELHNTHLGGVFVPSVIITNEIKKSSDYLLLFGGGVDCHSSLLRSKLQISGLVNIYGWLKSLEEENNVDSSDKTHTKEVSDRFGIKSYHVRSNFASQFDLSEIDKRYCNNINTSYWYGFLHSMAFLSISTTIAWINDISNLMIASSFTKDRANVHCGSYITTDYEFRFATSGKTIHDGFELSRQQKVQIIADFQRHTNKPYFFQACSFNDHNCCKCEKCFRTIIELIAEGVEPSDFGFIIEDSQKSHWTKIIQSDIALWGVKKESYYYNIAKLRMKENYANIKDKEFVDWFLNFDFEKAKKEGLKRYYRQNFCSILKRKFK